MKDSNRVAAAVLALLTVSAAQAQTRPSLDQLQAQLAALQSQVSTLNSQLVAVGARTGSVFVRWGEGSAPAGTTLLYEGVAHAGYRASTASGSTLCLGPLTLTRALAPAGEAFYPVSLAWPGRFGNYGHNTLKCAVVSTDRPTLVVVGDPPVPAGWQVLYRGLLFGASSLTPRPLDSLCIEFGHDDRLPRNYDLDGSVYIPTLPAAAPPETGGYVDGVTCARWMKN